MLWHGATYGLQHYGVYANDMEAQLMITAKGLRALPGGDELLRAVCRLVCIPRLAHPPK